MENVSGIDGANPRDCLIYPGALLAPHWLVLTGTDHFNTLHIGGKHSPIFQLTGVLGADHPKPRHF